MSHQDDLLLAFYGDDFTGSTDVMEALACAGLRTVLFLRPPTAEDLGRFPGVRAAGVAGVSRSLSPAGMDAELRPVFAGLRALAAPLVHYKICSTFDSSPEVGSIGRAIDLGQEVFASAFVPLLVGAPVLGRYCVFGNLFARSGPETEPFRLDRHPTMRHHPITPMDESDLRVHLSRQTGKRIGLFDILQVALPNGAAAERFAALLASGPEVVLFDILYDEQLPTIGGLIDSHARRDAPLFAVGSSGIEYALTAHWRRAGVLPEPPTFAVEPVERIAVVSGSCSPVTERQIARAAEQGFAVIPVRPERLVSLEEARAEHGDAARLALEALETGRSVILHTSLGPEDPRIVATRRRLEQTGSARSSAELLGGALGRLLREILLATGIRRAVVTGGDTSGYVARALGVEALEMRAPMAPGSPLCRIYASGPLDGTEILFKGGQVGTIDLFENVRRGVS